MIRKKKIGGEEKDKRNAAIQKMAGEGVSIKEVAQSFQLSEIYIRRIVGLVPSMDNASKKREAKVAETKISTSFAEDLDKHILRVTREGLIKREALLHVTEKEENWKGKEEFLISLREQIQTCKAIIKGCIHESITVPASGVSIS